MSGTVLSVQSQVAFGHVGNAAANFALQRLGVPTIAVPTIILSSHKGYGTARGFSLSASQLDELLTGVDSLKTPIHTLLSGYLGEADQAQALLAFLNRHPELTYILDPVMGDHGVGLFVDPALPGLFKNQALPRCQIFTPNRFELEILAGQTLADLPAIINAARSLLARGPQWCVVTSLELPDWPDLIGVLAVSQSAAWTVQTPKLHGRFNGTGDLFAALLTGHLTQETKLPKALERATATTYDIAAATLNNGGGELQLIPNQALITNPKSRFTALKL